MSDDMATPADAVDLRVFAETVLFGTTLSAKLWSPPAFTDLAPGSPREAPTFPGRPSELSALPLAKTKSFPSAKALENEQARGLVLHFFANHELLALELMALALLRFPEAPTEFRLGVARTLLEEQRHMRLYLNRMAELGVAFGDAPLSRFFWTCLAPMPSPLTFVTGMSLTFEQANLDYARHYAALFAKLGDQTTAELLQVVYREEIGHVKHGLQWFNHWREDEDDWQTYLRHLPPPLTPARAKGLSFHAEGRRRAGLSAHFIAELAVYEASKGRSPTLFAFNPSCESEVIGHTPAANIAALTADLAPLMSFVARQGDVVAVERPPSTTFRTELKDLGFTLPEYLPLAPSKEPLAKRLSEAFEKRQPALTIGTFEPWGWSPETKRALSYLKPVNQSHIPPAEYDHYGKGWSVSLLERYALEHGWNEELFGPRTVIGKVCRHSDEVLERADAIWRNSSGRIVIKAAFASSGRATRRFANLAELRDANAWIKRMLAAHGSVVVEPWLERLLDLSVQCLDGGRYGLCRFFTDVRGQYRGHLVGHMFDELPPDLRRKLFAPSSWRDALFNLADYVEKALAACSHAGPAGIDALVYQMADGSTRLKPLVEVNPRYTMGRIAWELQHRIAPGHCGLWLHINQNELSNAGYRSFIALAEELALKQPPQIQGAKLCGGVSFTTDPTTAIAVVTLLAVGPTENACRKALGERLLKHVRLF